MRADTDSYVEGFLQLHAHGSTGESERVCRTYVHIKILADLLNPDALWSRDVGLDFMRGGAAFVARLQRRQSVAMQRHVGISGVSGKALADHKNRLLVRIS